MASTSWMRSRSGTIQIGLEIPARFTDEPRVQVIGRIGNRVWSAFTTIRDGRVRIISVRRARDEEEKAYRQD